MQDSLCSVIYSILHNARCCLASGKFKVYNKARKWRLLKWNADQDISSLPRSLTGVGSGAIAKELVPVWCRYSPWEQRTHYPSACLTTTKGKCLLGVPTKMLPIAGCVSGFLLALIIFHCGVLSPCLWLWSLNPQKYVFFCTNICLTQEKMKLPGSWLYLPDSLSRYIFTSSVSLKIAIWLQWSIPASPGPGERHRNSVSLFVWRFWC